jgi:hypothetical protein
VWTPLVDPLILINIEIETKTSPQKIVDGFLHVPLQAYLAFFMMVAGKPSIFIGQ